MNLHEALAALKEAQSARMDAWEAWVRAYDTRVAAITACDEAAKRLVAADAAIYAACEILTRAQAETMAPPQGES